jgi:uncharacterized protein (DUF1778 family)
MGAANRQQICADNVMATPNLAFRSLVMLVTARRDSAAPRRPRKDDVIQIRASAETKAILTRAAALRGQKLSEFMLDSAQRQAEDALLDQRNFFLDPEAYDAFLALLDAPAEPNPELVELMSREAPWAS